MKIRPAYPDELARAKSILNDHPVPSDSGFLVGVKELPVERLVAAIPWWKVPGSEERALRYYLHSGGEMTVETLQDIQNQLEDLARGNGLGEILTDFSLSSGHPLYTQLIDLGYEVSRTDRYFTVPGETASSRSIRIHGRVKPRIPPDWKAQSIRGHDTQKLYALAAAHSLMSPQQFQHYWNTANREHFEEDYSFVLSKGDEILGILLLTRREQNELHIHAEAVHPDHLAHSALISACLRHASLSHCADGFPTIFTYRADSTKPRQISNAALRYGGSEGVPRHFLKRSLTPALPHENSPPAQ